eukprot:jgi/Chlat1/1434/Chrsp12S01992
MATTRAHAARSSSTSAAFSCVASSFTVLKQNYHFRQRALTLEEATIKDAHGMHGHIIVLGSEDTNLCHLVAPLRRASHAVVRPIVVVYERRRPLLPQQQQHWDAVGMFVDVFVLEVATTSEVVELQRLNVQHAYRVVLLSSQSTHNNNSNKQQSAERPYQERLADAQTLFLQHQLRALGCGPERIVCELASEASLAFFSSEKQQQRHQQQQQLCDEYYQAPAFAAGHACRTGPLADSLTCQAFYNKDIIPIVQSMLGGGAVASGKKELEQRDCGVASVVQIVVDPRFAGVAYAHYFCHLLYERGMVCLGLYRTSLMGGNRQSYVYTNPGPETVIDARDRAFVLSSSIPSDAPQSPAPAVSSTVSSTPTAQGAKAPEVQAMHAESVINSIDVVHMMRTMQSSIVRLSSEVTGLRHDVERLQRP